MKIISFVLWVIPLAIFAEADYTENQMTAEQPPTLAQRDISFDPFAAAQSEKSRKYLLNWQPSPRLGEYSKIVADFDAGKPLPKGETPERVEKMRQLIALSSYMAKMKEKALEIEYAGTRRESARIAPEAVPDNQLMKEKPMQGQMPSVPKSHHPQMDVWESTIGIKTGTYQEAMALHKKIREAVEGLKFYKGEITEAEIKPEPAIIKTLRMEDNLRPKDFSSIVFFLQLDEGNKEAVTYGALLGFFWEMANPEKVYKRLKELNQKQQGIALLTAYYADRNFNPLPIANKLGIWNDRFYARNELLKEKKLAAFIDKSLKVMTYSAGVLLGCGVIIFMIKNRRSIFNFITRLLLYLPALIFLALAFFENDKDFYLLLRIVIFATFAWLAYRRWPMRKSTPGLFFTLILAAIIYNPILPIHFGDKEIWAVLNLLTIGVLVWDWRKPQKN